MCVCLWWGRGWDRAGRAQLSCGHVDIDRMIIHDDNPNQGFFSGGEGERGRVQRKERGGQGIQSNNSHK